MTSIDNTINVLNHLLAIHNRSLPVYLNSAPPWAGHDGQDIVDALSQISGAHFDMVDRIGTMIIELGGVLRTGEFSMAFTGWHDLSTSYLLDRAIECQQQDVERITRCVDWLASSPRAKALAQESLGEAIAHLETLQETACETAPS